MSLGGSLLAWIEPHDPDGFIGAFVGEDAGPAGECPGRAPATQLCKSVNEARRWVEDQAAAFGVPVKWVDAIQSR